MWLLFHRTNAPGASRRPHSRTATGSTRSLSAWCPVYDYTQRHSAASARPGLIRLLYCTYQVSNSDSHMQPMRPMHGYQHSMHIIAILNYTLRICLYTHRIITRKTYARLCVVLLLCCCCVVGLVSVATPSRIPSTGFMSRCAVGEMLLNLYHVQRNTVRRAPTACVQQACVKRPPVKR